MNVSLRRIKKLTLTADDLMALLPKLPPNTTLLRASFDEDKTRLQLILYNPEWPELGATECIPDIKD